MNELKNDANSALNPKGSLNNRRGLGLPELMVAVASSMVVILGVATVMNMGVREFSVIYEQNKTLESLERASFFLRLYVQNALNVYGDNSGGIPLAPFAQDTTRGFLGGYDLGGGAPGFDSEIAPFGAAAKDGRAIPIGIFLIEDGGYALNAIPGQPANVSADGSNFRALALWFQFPDSTNAGRFSSGVLWIDTNAEPGVAGNRVPSGDDLWFDRLTKFRMEVIPAPADPPNPTGPAWQVDFDFTARYFLLPEQRSWFYDRTNTPGDMCEIACKDVPRNIRVALRNNALANSQISATGVVERSQGSMYYFKLNMPLRGQYIQAN